jgi:hypothetical protein
MVYISQKQNGIRNWIYTHLINWRTLRKIDMR